MLVKQLALIATGAATIMIAMLIGYWIGRNSVAAPDLTSAAEDDCYDVSSPKDTVRVLGIAPPPSSALSVGTTPSVTVDVEYRLDSHESAELALWQTTDRDGSTRSIPRGQSSISAGSGKLSLAGPLRISES